jgi:hypothetical protein
MTEVTTSTNEEQREEEVFEPRVAGTVTITMTYDDKFPQTWPEWPVYATFNPSDSLILMSMLDNHLRRTDGLLPGNYEHVVAFKLDPDDPDIDTIGGIVEKYTCELPIRMPPDLTRLVAARVGAAVAALPAPVGDEVPAS